MSFESSFLLSSLKAFFSLIAVIGLLYFFMRFLSKFSSVKGKVITKKGDIVQIVDKISLSPKKFIYFLRVGEKIFAIGVNGGINLLFVIEDSEVVKAFQSESGNSKFGGFSKVLRDIFSSQKPNLTLFSVTKEAEKRS
ncbi:MAG TPA: hypothetical protein ENL39_01390 [Candidatus Aerophobetes bacterium]|uniref:Flagellar protein n=1 Tax=Aerophobetes bacterium TaxID=2030807 RepID=A0A7V5HYA9_UNCAE|nr:hypothetical protein [Candidatus Aerophobetes bacterium]